MKKEDKRALKDIKLLKEKIMEDWNNTTKKWLELSAEMKELKETERIIKKRYENNN